MQNLPLIYQQQVVQREVSLQDLSLWPFRLLCSHRIRLRVCHPLAHHSPFHLHLLFRSDTLHTHAGVLA